jgi:predicted pyridoxine 5'-phosphate oxidase superfamily flavin-nucleotide-binding protein
MGHQFSQLMFTDAIKRLQERAGSRRQYERMAQFGPANDDLSAEEIEFIQQRDSFYIASEGENGWPYLQHRGGPKGFLKVLDGKTLAFADYSGNKQYITAGNVMHNDKVTLFLMDYPHRTRLKILGRAELVDLNQDPLLANTVRNPKDRSKVERLFKIRVVAFDWNCPQHITPRFSQEDILAEFERMQVEQGR